MIEFWKIQKNKRAFLQSGMTYVELIVVLSIFAVMSTIVFFNYGEFQAKVDIKNLASDIALKIVEAQKSAVAGTLPPLAQQGVISSAWRPSYGVYMNPGVNNKIFTYFTDLENATQNGLYDSSTCPGSGECLENITITKGNTISKIEVFYTNGTNALINDVNISFVRPSLSAVIKSSSAFVSVISYVKISIASPRSAVSSIKVYTSGRIQVN
ncbi:MAG: type II secretion system protein [bacterium]